MVPRLAPGWDPNSCTLTPAEGFLLSRIDGHTPWNALRQIGGIAPLAPDRKPDLARLAPRAMLGGAFASWTTATVAAAFV